MAGDITERMSAADYLAMVARGAGAAKGTAKRKNKFGNRRGLLCNGEKYDSGKELKHHEGWPGFRIFSPNDALSH